MSMFFLATSKLMAHDSGESFLTCTIVSQHTGPFGLKNISHRINKKLDPYNQAAFLSQLWMQTLHN